MSNQALLFTKNTMKTNRKKKKTVIENSFYSIVTEFMEKWCLKLLLLHL